MREVHFLFPSKTLHAENSSNALCPLYETLIEEFFLVKHTNSKCYGIKCLQNLHRDSVACYPSDYNMPTGTECGSPLGFCYS